MDTSMDSRSEGWFRGPGGGWCGSVIPGTPRRWEDFVRSDPRSRPRRFAPIGPEGPGEGRPRVLRLILSQGPWTQDKHCNPVSEQGRGGRTPGVGVGEHGG